jgi:phosphoribosylformylglycinamidine cyclo-ligase
LGANQSVQLDPKAWAPLPIFQWLQAEGHVPLVDMYNTFNMGIGFVIIVPADRASETLGFFQSEQIIAHKIGTIVEGNGEVLGLPT